MRGRRLQMLPAGSGASAHPRGVAARIRTAQRPWPVTLPVTLPVTQARAFAPTPPVSPGIRAFRVDSPASTPILATSPGFRGKRGG